MVRLKAVQGKDVRNWGARTDYLCARSLSLVVNGITFWHFADSGWVDYFESFEPRIGFKPKVPKPSTGLCAVFCAMTHLKPDVIGVIGFDAWFGGTDRKWNETSAPPKPHDWATELRCAQSLTRIIDLAKEEA